MNPKKRIMKFLNAPSCEHPPDETCEICAKVQSIQDGMSAGTATLFVTSAISDKYAEEYPIENMMNRGRYYTCRVVDYEGHTIEKLLVDKQTGDVRFV
jgi:hypothetical protein